MQSFNSSFVRFLFIALILIVVTAACDSETPNTPMPSIPTRAALNTSSPPTRQPTEQATELPNEGSPTQTSTESTKIVEAAPTATLEPIPPTDTPSPTPTPTRVIPGLIGPNVFPENVNPLTGKEIDDPEILQHRPIAIKISNISRVRPQSGINKADIIFEHITEGGITRFTAIYLTYDSRKIGSIRSGRLIDLEIPLMYDAAFGYSGSSAPLKQMFLESEFFERIISPDYGHKGFGRIFDEDNPDEFVEDTLYTDSYALRTILEERGEEKPPDLRDTMAFHPETPPNGVEIDDFDIRYNATNAFWYYSPGLGTYLRWSDGARHLDGNTDQQFASKNVIVLGAEHSETDIIEDSGGSRSIFIDLMGEGPMILFRDGFMYDGVWRRETPQSMLSFYDEEGNILPLAPGNTFFQIVPTDFKGLNLNP